MAESVANRFPMRRQSTSGLEPNLLHWISFRRGLRIGYPSLSAVAPQYEKASAVVRPNERERGREIQPDREDERCTAEKRNDLLGPEPTTEPTT